MTRDQFERYAAQAVDPAGDGGMYAVHRDGDTLYFTVLDFRYSDVDSGRRHSLSWALPPAGEPTSDGHTGGHGELYYLAVDWDSEAGTTDTHVRGLGMEGLAEWERWLMRSPFDELGLDILLP